MTREKAAELWQIIKAYGEGATIQINTIYGDWVDYEKEIVQFDNGKFRIKPELEEVNPFAVEDLKEDKEQSMKTYRPFTDTAELMVHYQGHFHVEYPPFYEPLIWVKRKQANEQSPDTRLFITGYDELCVFLEDVWIDLGELFEQYVFLDNSPCGKVVE